MNISITRRIKYFLRLNYPLQVSGDGHGYYAAFPDLPGCDAYALDLVDLYKTMEKLRRDWIIGQALRHEEIPLPNANLIPIEILTDKITTPEQFAAASW